MRALMLRNFPVVVVIVVVVGLIGARLIHQAVGIELITKDQALVIVMLTALFYVCAMILKLTDDEITRTLEFRVLPKHDGVVVTPSAPTGHPEPLPEHQEPVGSFSSYGGRSLGKSLLITLLNRYIENMQHQNLTLVKDSSDLQNMTREVAETLGLASVRVLTAARYRNVILGHHRADHVMIATKDFPEMLHGMMFKTITVSPMLQGNEPDWVHQLLKANEGKLAGTTCSYPHCHCPADHPGNRDWCFRGLPVEGL